MRAIEIAVKDLKIIVRDLKALAIIIAMPLILIVILGRHSEACFPKARQ